MGYYTTAEIVKIVNKLIDRCGTRDPYKVAKELGINIIYRNFDKQRGAYKVILKNRFVFLKNGMHPVVEQIVLWHEIGHDVLHRQEAVAVGGFKEFNIFDMRENRMEYEANIFASQASLPDDTILEYIENGYDIQQIARAMCSDINLIALKVDTLIAQGYASYNGYIKKLLGLIFILSDDFSVFEAKDNRDSDLLMCFTYHTHNVYLKDREITDFE